MPKLSNSPSALTICAIIAMMMPLAAIAEEPAPLTLPAVTQPAPAAEQKPAVKSLPATSLRIGYADILKIAEKSDAGKTAKTHFEAKADRYKSQIETKQKMLEKQKANLEAKLPTYTPEQRSAKIKDYEKKVDELRKMLQKADKEMKPMQEELTKSIFDKIRTAATSYGEANGYTVILIKSELLYLGKNADVQDITEELIQQLNKN